VRGGECNPGAAPLDLTPLSGSAVACELLVEVPDVVVGLEGVLVVLDAVTVSPAPPLPPAVRATDVG